MSSSKSLSAYHDVAKAVNAIRDFMASKVQLCSLDHGMAYYRDSSIDLIVSAIDTSRVRAIQGHTRFSMHDIAGVEALISVNVCFFSHGPMTTDAQSRTEYLILGVHDDPVASFVGLLKEIMLRENLKCIGDSEFIPVLLGSS